MPTTATFTTKHVLLSLVVVIVTLYFVLDTTPGLYLYDKFLGWSAPAPTDRYPTLNHKTIWITGASSGIGADLVCILMQQTKVHHVILSSRRADKLLQVAQQCSTTTSSSSGSSSTTTATTASTTTTTPTGPTFSIVEYDALDTRANVTHAVVQQALASSPTGSIDVLILNAGIYQSKGAMDTTLEETRNIFRVNFEAPVALALEVIRQDHWKERRSTTTTKSTTTTTKNSGNADRPQIVLVNSLMGRGPAALSSSYAASKAASRNYFLTLSTEEWTWLKVNVVLPGATKTALWDPRTAILSNPSSSSSLEEAAAPPPPEETTKESNKNNKNGLAPLQPDGGTLMNSDRVAQLILSGMVGPHILFVETWICQYSGLLYAYLSTYTPIWFMITVHLAGLVRVVAAHEERLDVLELVGIARRLIGMVGGWYPTRTTGTTTSTSATSTTTTPLLSSTTSTITEIEKDTTEL